MIFFLEKLNKVPSLVFRLNKFALIITPIIIIALTTGASPARAEKISGKACYRYGTTEFPAAAKFIALTLAKRAALEGYKPFREATVNMWEPALREELLTNLTTRALKNINPTEETNDPKTREICQTLTAEVEAEEVTEMVSAVFFAVRNRRIGLSTGLPENEYIQILKVEETFCAFDRKAPCVSIVVRCYKNSFGARHPVRVTWRDQNGIPDFTINEYAQCLQANDVENFMVRLPPKGHTFKVDLP